MNYKKTFKGNKTEGEEERAKKHGDMNVSR